MREKRTASERPECVEDMTLEQLQDEKVSMQKELLHLENTFGQTAARNEELFSPIYARYRTVKRFLARSSASVSLPDNLWMNTVLTVTRVVSVSPLSVNLQIISGSDEGDENSYFRP